MVNTDKQRNIKGLRPWKKGQSGNPKGRPRKDVSLTSLIKKELDKIPEILIDKKINTKTWRELLVFAWLAGAYKGNSTLFKELIERLEGKIAQPLTGEGGKDLIPKENYIVRLAEGGIFQPSKDGDGDGHKPGALLAEE